MTALYFSSLGTRHGHHNATVCIGEWKVSRALPTLLCRQALEVPVGILACAVALNVTFGVERILFLALSINQIRCQLHHCTLLCQGQMQHKIALREIWGPILQLAECSICWDSSLEPLIPSQWTVKYKYRSEHRRREWRPAAESFLILYRLWTLTVGCCLGN